MNREIIDWNNCHTPEQLDSIATTKNDLGVDCISRAEARKTIIDHQYSDSFCEEHNIDHSINTSMALIALSDLPSVTPQELDQYYKDLAESYEKTITKLTKAIAEQEPRKGMRWIGRFETYEWGKEEWCECPWCHMDSAEAYNFCPNCGADFREVKKSEG